MEDVLVPIVVMVSMFGSLFGILYIYFTTRNRERMAMIEKGIGAELFNSSPKQPRFTNWVLKLGMLVLGIGIGLAVAVFVAPIFQDPIDKIIVYWAFILSFGGLGLICSFIIEKKMKKE
jgi:hypothetical protein